MKTGAFDHEATAAMAEAYDAACQSIDDWGQPDIIKETIAQRIIEVAEKGERDPGRLCERALRRFQEPFGVVALK
jgi:hypothetical protein